MANEKNRQKVKDKRLKAKDKRQKKGFHSPCNIGFTLVEIVVVVGIISAASTGMYQVIKRGKATECSSNLRQIHQAVSMFIMDNNVLPDAKFFPESSSDPKGIQNLLKQYGISKGICFCPSIGQKLNIYGTNYIWNDSLSNKTPGSSSSSDWLMTEMTAVSSKISSPHSAGYMILYADGHVKIGPRVKFPEVSPAPPKKQKEVVEIEEPVPVSVKKFSRIAVRFPSEIKIGEKVNIGILFLDDAGNLCGVKKGSLILSSSDKSAKIPKDIKISTEGRGSIAFDGTFFKSGQQWLKVKEKQTGIEKNIEFRVLPGKVASFSIKGISSSFESGKSAVIKITTIDMWKNITQYDGRGFLCDTDSNINPEEITFSKGLWEGEVLFTKACEKNKIFVSDGEKISTTGFFEVKAGSPEKAGILFSDEIIAGKEFKIKFVINDKFGNICKDYKETLNVEVIEAKGKKSLEKISFHRKDSGEKNLNFTLFSAGKAKIRVFNENISEKKEIYINPGLIDHFVIDEIKTQVAGNPFSIFVKAEDQWGNKIKGFYLVKKGGSVKYTQEDFSSGMWMESIVITKSGKESFLELNDGYGHKGKSNIFEVKPEVPEKIVIENLSKIVNKGSFCNFNVLIKDRFGNSIKDYKGNFIFSCSDGKGKLVVPQEKKFPLSLSAKFETPGPQFIEIEDKNNSSLKLKYRVFVIRIPDKF